MIGEDVEVLSGLREGEWVELPSLPKVERGATHG